MELKNAVAVCLISLFSASLVVLIARALDIQAASRIEPQLASIAEELRAIRAGGGISAATATASTASGPQDGLIAYYFHSNTRCPTCESIESQAHAALELDFADELERGEIVWKTLNYESPAHAALAKRFGIQVPVVVLARMQNGEIDEWQRLDEVWGLVGDEPKFAELIRTKTSEMLAPPATEPSQTLPEATAAIPLPTPETNAAPAESDTPLIPVPE